MQSWNDFFLPLVLTLSRPDLRTLAVGMFAFQGEYFTDWSGMAAAATISLLPIIIISPVPSALLRGRRHRRHQAIGGEKS